MDSPRVGPGAAALGHQRSPIKSFPRCSRRIVLEALAPPPPPCSLEQQNAKRNYNLIASHLRHFVSQTHLISQLALLPSSVEVFSVDDVQLVLDVRCTAPPSIHPVQRILCSSSFDSSNIREIIEILFQPVSPSSRKRWNESSARHSKVSSFTSQIILCLNPNPIRVSVVSCAFGRRREKLKLCLDSCQVICITIGKTVAEVHSLETKWNATALFHFSRPRQIMCEITDVSKVARPFPIRESRNSNKER